MAKLKSGWGLGDKLKGAGDLSGSEILKEVGTTN